MEESEFFSICWLLNSMSYQIAYDDVCVVMSE